MLRNVFVIIVAYRCKEYCGGDGLEVVRVRILRAAEE